MKRVLLIHYGEIGLKKKNRQYFLGKLRHALKFRLEQKFKRTFVIKHSLGRFLIDLPDDFDEEAYCEVVGKIFGIKNYKFTYCGPVDLEALGEAIWDELPELKEFDTFCVRAKRAMVLPYKSFEAEKEIGAVLLKKGIGLSVKMKDPDLLVDIEFLNETAYFSFKKYMGAGGLSSGSGGRLVSLISSGFDSPVAAYKMMQRGARVVFVHFHSYPYTEKEEIENVKEIVKVLSSYQLDTKLYLLPFGKVQKQIGTNLKIPGSYRTVLFRRLMLRIAEDIALQEEAVGLITGDNYGQVASQTPYNLRAVHQVTQLPLYQPLIGYDKETIILEAEKIGTAEISKRPCKDTCTMFGAKRPELKARIKDLLELESYMPVADFVKEVLDGAEKIYF